MLTIKPNMTRMKEIAKRWNAGESQAQIGRELKLTRQRVLQIIKHQCPLYDVHVISYEEWVAERNKRWAGKA